MALLDKIEKKLRKNNYGVFQFLEFLGETSIAFVEALRNPFKIRWRETFYYLEQCGVKSLPIVLIICFLLGVILAFQGALQLAQFGTQIFIVDLVGWSVLMELGPFMVAIIATGRAGSAFAAEIGTMIADEEVNALSTMGISVARFLVIPKLLALAVAMPLLTCFGNIAALIGGLFIGVTVGDVPMTAYVSRTLTVLTPDAFLFGVGKSVVFAVIIALVGCFRGLQSTMDAQGVGRSATNAVVTSIFAVVISDAIITLLKSM
jgi:phospholipid/cholesterol/gamma-HCH transport system permease protein